MRDAMAHADVGDDVFGEDPTVRALEERVADLLGHEAGLFAPSGSLANQLGLRLHVGPGQELVADQQAHVLRAEMGAGAVFSGITSRSWPSERGLLDPAGPLSLVTTGVGPYQVDDRARRAREHPQLRRRHGAADRAPSARCAPPRRRSASRCTSTARGCGTPTWPRGCSLRDYGAEFDTVSVCLSKGLGAPVGSVLVGSAEQMAAARIWRKRYGAGMRQVGILAAAGLYALDHNIERLADDHARAARFAAACAEAAPAAIDAATVETNIVVLDVGAVGWAAPEFVAALLEHGVRTYAVGPGRVRAVWHLDVDDAGTDAAVDSATALLRQRVTLTDATPRP